MKISSIGLGVLCAASLCGVASAAETSYGAGTRALPLQQSGGTARAMSMGSAVVAVDQCSASLLWNPAGLGGMRCKELAVHHNSGLGGTLQEIFVFGMPLGEVKDDGKGGSMGGIAASIGYVNYGSFTGADAAGNETGNYSAGDYSMSVGWGKELFRNVSGGFTLKGNRSAYSGQGYNALSADLGVLWKATGKLDLGASYSNFGTKVGGDGLSAGLRLGAGYKVDKHWLLAASSELQNKAMKRLQLGTEYLIGNVEEKANVLALRGGYQFSFPSRELGALAGLTWGLGYTITRSIALDYAMLPTGDLGIGHRLSLTYKFGCSDDKKTAAVAAAPAAAAVVAAPVVAPVAASRPVKKEPVVLKSIVLEDSHFDFDKSALRPEGMAALRENVQLLKENPKANVRIEGHTSLRGTPEYNQRLSERRAFAVRDFLVAEGGIAQNRITTIGYGETRPTSYEASPKKADQGSAAAKSNMRVIFDITVD
ncbi:MAG: PorV/PorQ family protein [Elusimicrobiota bacterium]|nr:PorV/PorQ family protein [Elusimicrobiota bacterium]